MNTLAKKILCLILVLTLISGVSSIAAVGSAVHQVRLPLVVNAYSGSGCDSRPTLISPANGSQLDTLVPTYIYDLKNDPQAIAARFQVAKDADFTQLVADWRLTGDLGLIISIDYMNREPATTYFWRTFLECRGAQGPYSETWSFTTGSGGIIPPAPKQIAPPDGSELPGLEVTLKWAKVPGSLDYLVVLFFVNDGIGFGIQAPITEIHYTMLEPESPFEWMVLARNSYAYGDWSEKWSFHTPMGGKSHPGNSWPEEANLVIGPDGVIRYFQPGLQIEVIR